MQGLSAIIISVIVFAAAVIITVISKKKVAKKIQNKEIDEYEVPLGEMAEKHFSMYTKEEQEEALEQLKQQREDYLAEKAKNKDENK